MHVFCNTKQLVVLGHAVGPRGCTGLDLPCSGSDGKVCDGDVFGFSAAMGHDVVHAVRGGQIHGFKRLGHRPDLIHFDQHGVGRPQFDALSQPFGLGDEQVIAPRSARGGRKLS